MGDCHSMWGGLPGQEPSPLGALGYPGSLTASQTIRCYCPKVQGSSAGAESCCMPLLGSLAQSLETLRLVIRISRAP